MTHKHTPEPWEATRGPRNWAIRASADPSSRLAQTHHGSPSTTQANAARIVACVNGCQGINPAAIPDLLAALEAYLTYRPAFRAMPVGAPGSAARIEQDLHIGCEDQARAAIAKANS